jgi:hypothetical protein
VAQRVDPAKQEAFIKAYEDRLNHLGDDEVVLLSPAGEFSPKVAARKSPLCCSRCSILR